MKLEIKNMDFGYDSESLVLHDINLCLDKPGLICIIGPNGVGKSTLVRCIDKLISPTRGEILIDGRNISEMSYKDLSEYIGYVPVATHDYFPMTVLETVMMGRHPRQSLRSRTKDDFDMVYDILVSVKAEKLSMKSFGDLSAGQHQRVAIARGLAQEPKLLILDEPTANLDARFQIMITRLLQKLANENNIIILMISHDLNIASRFADEVVLMSEPGIIYRTGKSEDVVTRENIRFAYGVDCRITEVDGRPHVILLNELSDEEYEELHRIE